jgi:Flp pilus assembly secretin CpaC
MKAQYEWCGPLAWLLAASLMMMLQAGLARADQSVTINRGERYMIQNVDGSSRPEVNDSAHALIVTQQPDGEVLVLGAQAGSATVKVKLSDGKSETYNITVAAVADPKNPLAPGVSPEAAPSTPLDAGAGPAADKGAADKPTDSGASAAPAASDKPAGATGASAASAPTTAATADSAAASDKSAAEKPTDTSAAAPATADKPAEATGAPAASAPAAAPAVDSSAAAAVTGGEAGPTASSSASLAPAEAASGPAPEVIGSQSAQQAATAPAPAAQKYKSDPHAVADDGTVAADHPHRMPEDAITLMTGTSRLYDFPARIKRVSIADSGIADVQVINPHQLMLVGHKPGFTTLAVWQQGKYEERQVRIEQTGQQQVLLNCVVAEVNRSRLEQQGINLTMAFPHAGVSGVGLPGSVATSYSAQSQLNVSGAQGSSAGGILPFGGELIPMILSNNLTYGLTTDNSAILTQSFFQFLEDHSLGRILAEPRILANSGEEAKFLSGGEIPIVLAQALNTSVVFKQFGTSVTFIPTVVGKHAIELVVRPEVSKPDFSQGVQLFGFTVPAFVTRRAETVVRMNDDQTLIIAGLILRDREATVQKVPYLGDIPWMGSLFHHTSYQDTKSELVMSVTPQIVMPLPAGAQVATPASAPLEARDISTSHLSEPDVSRPRLW